MIPLTLDLNEINATLEPLSVDQRLLWASDRFGNDLVQLSSMQRSASVLMHLFHVLGLHSEVLFVDTGYHFAETLRFRDEWVRRYGLNLVTLYPELTCEAQEAQYHKKLFTCVDGQPECCHIRKEVPLIRYLRDTRSCPVITNGLRRGEGGRRQSLRALQPDPRVDGFAFSPIFDWSEDDISEYLRRNDVPVHPLHSQGYPSIGCSPCTTPVAPGEHVRAGRWRHLRSQEEPLGVQYCGINFSDGSGI